MSLRAAWELIEREGERWGIKPMIMRVRGEPRVYAAEVSRKFVNRPSGMGYVTEELEPIGEVKEGQPFSRILLYRLRRHERRVADRLAVIRAREEAERQREEEDRWQPIRNDIKTAVRRHGAGAVIYGR